MPNHKFITILERLTGHKLPIIDKVHFVEKYLEGPINIGFSQFNEIMLLLGYDRVSPAFFQYLVSGNSIFEPTSVISSIDDFEIKSESFIKLALLLLGNVKFAFKRLSSDEDELINWLESFKPLDADYFTHRHLPVLPLELIAEEETYYGGYIVASEIQKRIDKNPDDQEAKEMQQNMKKVIEQGERNQLAYLASDHLDVYVATSMRLRHEYLFISRISKEIFGHAELSPLKIRYFDPTQAYCPDRIDKGISEGLMLKRARCTIYLAQESDTLGKDSELASTLAQGKPVVAYIPVGDKKFVDDLLDDLQKLYKSKSKKEILIEQMKIFCPQKAWDDNTLRKWIEDGTDDSYATGILYEAVYAHYEKRAVTLKETHPLGIQVNLETGVANGVLMVRTVNDCAKLVKTILIQNMDFRVQYKTNKGIEYTILEEKISTCIYRVATGDQMLTNTFWNFYIR